MQATTMQAAPEDVRAFIQEYFDAWKGTDESKILAYYSGDVEIHLPTGALKVKLQCGTILCAHSSQHSPATSMPFAI